MNLLLLITQTWTFGPFVKPAQVNPIITPNPTSHFRSPMTDSVVAWEEYATFNPAAVVKDGKVYVLYRAEDASGEMRIGRHTSRIGRSEEHTSELQSRPHLVCRLLLEKTNKHKRVENITAATHSPFAITPEQSS